MSDRMKVIVENLMDIIEIGGKLMISYIRDGWNQLSLLWSVSEDEFKSPNDWENDEMWNGGVTNKKGSRIDDTNEDNTLVYDEYTIDGNIIYDGVMGEIND